MNAGLTAKYRPEETEIRTQAHLMDAEGTTDEEPTPEEITSLISNFGYKASDIEVFYDTLQSTWRWNCNIKQLTQPERQGNG